MLAAGDKKRALLALRRKKYQESLLAKTDAQLEQLEKLTSSVEFALIQKDVVFGLQQGTRVLKEIHAEMGGVEQVEKLMGDTAEAIAYQKVHLRSLLCGGKETDNTSRKSVICWAIVSLTKTRKRSRRNWQRSRPKLWEGRKYNSRYQMFQIHSYLYGKLNQKQNRSGKRSSGRPC